MRLNATGAASLRARVCRAGEGGAVSVAMSDDAGEMIASVSSVIGREVSRMQLAGASGAHRDSLFKVEWIPVATQRPGPSAAGWALLGAEGSALARACGQPPAEAEAPDAAYADLGTLGRAIAAGAAVPPVVVADFTTAAAGEGLGGLADAARGTLHRALALIQGWLADERLAASTLVVVTERAVAARAGEGVPDLAGAPLWGLVRSAQSEHPERMVLVDWDGTQTSLEVLEAALGTGEPQVALRAGAVVAPRVARVGGAADAGPPVIDEQGTALITGGTGGLGAVVARHLVAEHGVRSVLLTSRRGPEAEGAAELASELAGLGAQVRIAACDVADREQLRALIASVPDEHPLRAVVHTAGVADNALIASLAPEQVDRVLAPKLDAALHLHELTEDLDLQVFALFSSMAATFGGPGQANYAAGNAFLDALAEHRRARGLAATAMAWGLWTEVGMGRFADELVMHRMVGSASFGSLSPEQGRQLFDAALASGEAQVIQAPLNSGTLRAEARAGVLPRLLSGLIRMPLRQAAVPAGGSAAARLAGLPAQERERAVHEAVRAEVAAVLGHASAEAVPAQQLFIELGLDSLAAVELRNRLNAMTGARLPATAVFDHPTAAALAERLHAELVPRWEGGERGEAAAVDPSAAADLLAAGPPATGEPADAASFAGEPASTLSSLLSRARELGRVDEFTGMVATAASLRPAFDACLEPQEAPRPIRLCEGPKRAGVICFPSLLATAGPHQYVRFARAFRGVCEVSALPTPGFLQGERVPSTLRAAVETQAATVLREGGEAPIVLLGHSTGGILAYAVARQLEDAGAGPAAVVLIDTYWSGSFATILPQAIGGMLERDGAYAAMNDANLTAMTVYGQFVARWEPAEIHAPTLLVRASEPLLGAAPAGEGGEWRPAVAIAHTARDAPGDHFSMMEEHAEATAETVRAWLGSVLGV